MRKKKQRWLDMFMLSSVHPIQHCSVRRGSVFSPLLLSYLWDWCCSWVSLKAGAGCLVWCSTYYYRPYLSSSVFIVQIERLEQILYKLSPFNRDDSFLMESGQIFLWPKMAYPLTIRCADLTAYLAHCKLVNTFIFKDCFKICLKAWWWLGRLRFGVLSALFFLFVCLFVFCSWANWNQSVPNPSLLC